MKRILKEIVSLSIYILVILGITYLVIHYVGQRTVVEGHSMMPTLMDGDSLIVDKLSYRFVEPKRFDIVVFPYEHADHTYYIKRIIGLPGESVRIDADGVIYINGEVLDEDFGAEQMLDPGRAVEELHLKSDEYFVLGDNRNNSTDSRVEDVGNIHRGRLIGRAVLRVWPLSEFGTLD
ncbi:MAG: signal peptidase I [Lachnospiraceae bacterium]|nr:signal peptidase I [Lachnospiraceae bacterium]